MGVICDQIFKFWGENPAFQYASRFPDYKCQLWDLKSEFQSLWGGMAAGPVGIDPYSAISVLSQEFAKQLSYNILLSSSVTHCELNTLTEKGMSLTK
jgi:hypothetical protein